MSHLTIRRDTTRIGLDMPGLESTDRQVQVAITDTRGRVSLAQFGAPTAYAYEVYVGTEGSIVLSPLER